MEQHMIQFIAALRGVGVRISVAESTDAMRAIEQIGLADKDLFRAALQTALVKEAHHLDPFQQLFAVYFGDAPPPMQQPGEGGMSAEEQQMLQQMLQQMMQQMTPEELARLFQAMMSGHAMSQEEMRDLLEHHTFLPFGRFSPAEQQWMTRRAMRQLQMHQLEQALADLLEQLRESGMSAEALQQIEQMARENQQTLAKQVEQQVARAMLEQAQQQGQGPPADAPGDMLDRPFELLSQQDVDQLRREINRLAARIRSRIALRQRRSKSGTLDAKSTIRSSLRFGGVPMVVHHRRRHMKPRITVLCDLSYSMRPVTGFTLLLIYALQDQISRTRSFAFIDDLNDITTDFAEQRPEQALETIQQRILPPCSYATDLGTSLSTFQRDYLSCVDHRTTLIILGDGRNNYRNPNLKAFEEICRRARRVIWFNPEEPHKWGVEYPDTLNSDMLEYARMCDAVHYVSNLRHLATAIDTLFTRSVR